MSYAAGDVNKKDFYKNTALHRAACMGYTQIVKLLVEQGADVDAQAKDGWTPLHLAARWGRIDAMRVLVDEGHADVNIKTSDGRTAAITTVDRTAYNNEHGYDALMSYSVNRNALAESKYLMYIYRQYSLPTFTIDWRSSHDQTGLQHNLLVLHACCTNVSHKADQASANPHGQGKSQTRQLILSLLLCGASAAESSIKNADILRRIHLQTNIVKVTTKYTLSGAEAQDKYTFLLPLNRLDRLSYLQSNVNGKKTAYERIEDVDGFAAYRVQLTAPTAGDIKVLTYALYTDVLMPYPKAITQTEQQYMLYSDSSYVPSVYDTVQQQTEVQLTPESAAANQYKSFTGKQPVTISGNYVKWGPYSDIQSHTSMQYTSADTAAVEKYINSIDLNKLTSDALYDTEDTDSNGSRSSSSDSSSSNKHLFVHYMNNAEISHWGNIAVEEFYDIEHHGAKLEGGFSRLDHTTLEAGQRSQLLNTATSNKRSYPAFQTLIATLPRTAKDIYYRDNIGNVSTSTISYDSAKTPTALLLAVKLRYPMLGGWKSAWYQVILPEGAHDIQVNVPFEVQEQRTRRFTYLDTPILGGRPVIKLKIHNIVPDHNVMFEVKYKFNKVLMLIEPMILVTAVLALLLCVIAFVRLTSGINSNSSSSTGSSRKGTSSKRSSPTATEGSERVQQVAVDDTSAKPKVA
eukprot:20388-Heterococcus_DN1.PRE.3